MQGSRDRWLAVGLMTALVAAAIVRLAVFGWAGMAPDDGRYLYVGLSILDGQGAITPAGDPYLLRAPAYGLVLAAGARLMGGDVLVAAHVAAALIGIAGLLLAAALAWRLGGAPATAATSVVLLVAPLPWTLLPTLRVDQALGALVMGLALVAAVERPRLARAVAAGGLLGLAVLVKETVLPLAILPVAWLAPRWLGPWSARAAAFLITAALVAAWWWVYVWAQGHVLFPFNALQVIEARQVDAGGRVARGDLVIGVVAVAAWAVVAWRAARRPLLRVLVAVFAGLVPAAAYAAASGLAARNFLPLALASSVAIGLMATEAWAWAASRLAGRPASVRRALGVGCAAAYVMAVVVGQLTVARPVPAPLPGEIAEAVRGSTAPGAAVVMTFRDREAVAVELFGRNPVRPLDPSRVTPGANPADYRWLGLRDQQLFGFTREKWAQILGRPETAVLVIVEPHPLSPTALLPSLMDAAQARSTGLRTSGEIETPGAAARLFTVDPATAVIGAADGALHMDADAALAWLAMDGSTPAKLAAARPVLSPDGDLEGLRAAIGSEACLVPAGPAMPNGWLRLQPAADGC